MKTYEITFITKEDIEKLSTGGPIKDILTTLDGKILNVSSIGEKQFTYKIKKENKGFYTTVVFEIDPNKLVELNKKLTLVNEILRFLIVIHKENEPVKTKKVDELEPIKAKKEDAIVRTAKEDVIAISRESVDTKETKAVKKEKPKDTPKKETKPKKTVVKNKITEIETETVSEEDRLKALDKKLDELLKE